MKTKKSSIIGASAKKTLATQSTAVEACADTECLKTEDKITMKTQTSNHASRLPATLEGLSTTELRKLYHGLDKMDTMKFQEARAEKALDESASLEGAAFDEYWAAFNAREEMLQRIYDAAGASSDTVKDTVKPNEAVFSDDFIELKLNESVASTPRIVPAGAKLLLPNDYGVVGWQSGDSVFDCNGHFVGVGRLEYDLFYPSQQPKYGFGIARPKDEGAEPHVKTTNHRRKHKMVVTLGMSLLGKALYQCFDWNRDGTVKRDASGQIVLKGTIYKVDAATRRYVGAILEAELKHKYIRKTKRLADLLSAKPATATPSNETTTGWDQLMWVASYIVRRHISSRLEYMPDSYIGYYDAACIPFSVGRGKFGNILNDSDHRPETEVEDWRFEAINAILTAVADGRFRWAIRDAFKALSGTRKDVEQRFWTPYVDEEDPDGDGDFIESMVAAGFDGSPEVSIPVTGSLAPIIRDDDIDLSRELDDLLNSSKREIEAVSWFDYKSNFVVELLHLFCTAETVHVQADWNRFKYVIQGYTPEEIAVILGNTTASVSKMRTKFLYWLLEEVERNPEDYETLFKFGLADPRIQPELYTKPNWMVKKNGN